MGYILALLTAAVIMGLCALFPPLLIVVLILAVINIPDFINQ